MHIFYRPFDFDGNMVIILPAPSTLVWPSFLVPNLGGLDLGLKVNVSNSPGCRITSTDCYWASMLATVLVRLRKKVKNITYFAAEAAINNTTDTWQKFLRVKYSDPLDMLNLSEATI